MTLIKPCLKYGAFFLVAAFLAGCTYVEKGYFIEPYYKPITTYDHSIKKRSGTIHISTIEFDKPDVDLHWETFPIRLLKILPVLSAIPIVDLTAKNSCYYSYFNIYYTVPREGELEEILASEIKNTGMFDNVCSQNTQGDYDVKGYVNFTIEGYGHNSGLGILYGGLLPMLFLPTATDHYKCEAFFEVISAKDSTILFSKDYKVETNRLVGFFSSYYDYNVTQQRAHNEIIGQQIFPAIVSDFINDLKHNIQSQSPILTELK